MKTRQAPGKALVVIPYFGTLGPWVPLYLHSLARQSTLDVVLFTDATVPVLPPNVREVRCSLSDIRELAEKRLDSSVCLPSSRKLCDLKPAYGLIFGDYIGAYDFWAFGDEDVCYGDTDRLLGPALSEGPDVLVSSRKAINGHLTILRNTSHVNELVLDDPQYRTAIASPDLWAYDETSWARPAGSGSFTRTVKDAEAREKISVTWGVPVRGDVPSSGRSYAFEDGTIRDNDGAELAYYHWGRAKSAGFRFPGPEQASKGFAYDRFGFSDLDIGSGADAARRARWFSRKATGRLKRMLGG